MRASVCVYAILFFLSPSPFTLTYVTLLVTGSRFANYDNQFQEFKLRVLLYVCILYKFLCCTAIRVRRLVRKYALRTL